MIIGYNAFGQTAFESYNAPISSIYYVEVASCEVDDLQVNSTTTTPSGSLTVNDIYYDDYSTGTMSNLESD